MIYFLVDCPIKNTLCATADITIGNIHLNFPSLTGEDKGEDDMNILSGKGVFLSEGSFERIFILEQE